MSDGGAEAAALLCVQRLGDPVAMGMAAPLGNILVQLSGGGGATKLNIDAGE